MSQHLTIRTDRQPSRRCNVGDYYAIRYRLDDPVWGEVVEVDGLWRLVRGFSAACPEGELGWQLVLDLLPVSGRLFKAALDNDWMLDIHAADPPHPISQWEQWAAEGALDPKPQPSTAAL